MSSSLSLQSDRIRKLARTSSADEKETVGMLVDLWVDVAFKALSAQKLDPKVIETALIQGGVKAEDLNELGEKTASSRVASHFQKQAGAMDTVKALGGKVLKWVWHTATHPFVLMWQHITSDKVREATKAFIKNALHKEGAQTKAMLNVARLVMRGEEVPKADMTAAIHQFGDLLKVAIIVGGGLHEFGPEMMHDPLHVLALLASPADEVAGILLDGPLRIVTKYLTGQAHGLLPSSFYE